ncbi:MAG TPA: CPBP family intramembrane glutamic endopeptidase [Pirellulales bacterium]
MLARFPLLAFFVLTFAITWGVGGLGLVIELASPDAGAAAAGPLLFLAGYGPTLAGLLLTLALAGRSSVVALLGKAIPQRANRPWYLAVAVGYPTLMLAVGGAFDVPTPAAKTFVATPPDALAMLGLLAAALVVDTGPLGEEFGWRGFALPRLLQRFSPLIASVLLGSIWAAWHLPAFFLPHSPLSRIPFLLFLAGAIALSLLMTWLYQRSRGDLGLLIVAHAAANSCAGAIDFHWFTGLNGALALGVMLSTRFARTASASGAARP